MISRYRKPRPRLVVHDWCTRRTNLNIDDEACAEVVRRCRCTTKREAVNYALRALASDPLSVDEAKSLRGTGWVDDLAETRTTRTLSMLPAVCWHVQRCFRHDQRAMTTQLPGIVAADTEERQFDT